MNEYKINGEEFTTDRDREKARFLITRAKEHGFITGSVNNYVITNGKKTYVGDDDVDLSNKENNDFETVYAASPFLKGVN